MQDQEVIREFPRDSELLASIFLAFSRLEKIAHETEKLLGQLREGERKLTPSLAPLILETVDATRNVLYSIEEDAAKSSAVADTNIRVGVGLLDRLMDLVGELVLARNPILQFNTEREDAALNATSQRLNPITAELQEAL